MGTTICAYYHTFETCHGDELLVLHGRLYHFSMQEARLVMGVSLRTLRLLLILRKIWFWTVPTFSYLEFIY